MNFAFSIPPSYWSLKNSMSHNKKRIKNDMILIPDVFHCIQSVQFNALNIKTYQKIVKNRGMIYILNCWISMKYVSRLIIHPKILLIYHIFIEVIQIIAHISIWKNNLTFGLTSNLSSKKLIPVIKNQNTQISHNLKLYSKYQKLTASRLSKKNHRKKTIHIEYGIGSLLNQYFFGLSNMSSL